MGSVRARWGIIGCKGGCEAVGEWMCAVWNVRGEGLGMDMYCGG